VANLILIFALLAGCGIAVAAPPNWSGDYAPCNRHEDLVGRKHLDLGVRISTSNPALARQFEDAMDFWARVLDLEWHEDDSENCSIQLVDGAAELFAGADDCECISARAQLPNRPDFQGLVAFNPDAKLTEREMFAISLHEIGHLLGLHHNPSGSSVMFFFGLEGSESLDAADLDALASRHRLRPGIVDRVVTSVPIANP
jgi:hypothetical protein